MAIMARQEYSVLVSLWPLGKHVNAGASCFGEESQVIPGMKEKFQYSGLTYF